jgi:hypothetical protein
MRAESSLRQGEKRMAELDHEKKEPRRTSGAPFPPAQTQSDGPADRPRHDVPSEPDDDQTDSDAEEET